jgi:hypothetical protein
LALSYSPDILILQYCDNDIDPPRYPFGFLENQVYVSPKVYLLKMGDSFVPAFPLLSKEANRLLLEHSAFLRFLSFKVNILFNNFYISKDASLTSLRKMKQAVDEKKTPMIIIATPPSSLGVDACSDEDLAAQRNDVKGLADNLGVPFYNICDYVDDIHSISSKKTIDNGYHYGQEGHKLIAEILGEAIWKKIDSENN